MDFQKVKEYIKASGLPNFRLKQVQEALFKKGISSWDEATSLPADLRENLKKDCPILSFQLAQIICSHKDKAAKALLTLRDGLQIETVLLKPQDTWSVCVSSQVGCALHCSFCSTGKMGFKRDLTCEEITDQVLFWFEYLRREKLGERISNIVFMGMGEPLLNYVNVVKAVRELSGENHLNIGTRHISISTSGIADKLHKLAMDLPQVNLAVSLHNADNKERSKIMPVNRKFNLDDLKKALEEYIAMTGRQVFLEYAVLENVNSRPEHIRKLADWIYSIKDNYLLHVNLIACNLGRGEKTDDRIVKDFAAGLKGMGIGVTIRKSMGNDILAACGQLAGRKN